MDNCIDCVLLVSKDCPYCKQMFAQMSSQLKNTLRQVGVRVVMLELAVPQEWMFLREARGGLYVETIVTPSIVCYDPKTGAQLMHHRLSIDQVDQEKKWVTELSMILRSLWAHDLCHRPTSVATKRRKRRGGEGA